MGSPDSKKAKGTKALVGKPQVQAGREMAQQGLCAPRTSAHRPTIPWGSQNLPHIPEGAQAAVPHLPSAGGKDTGEFQRGWGGHQPCMCKKPPHPAAQPAPTSPAGHHQKGSRGRLPSSCSQGGHSSASPGFPVLGVPVAPVGLGQGCRQRGQVGGRA